MDPSFYFSDSYADARSRFQAMARRSESILKTTFSVSQLQTVTHADEHTDLLLLRRKKRTQKNKLIIISSGVHGIEGFTGSALQIKLLTQPSFFENVMHSDILFIHALNPWGMIHKQRTNKENVDLNRNCSQREVDFQQRNPFIKRFESVLAPQFPAGHMSLMSIATWHSELIRRILSSGLQRSILAITNGQFEDPTQLFYGGNKVDDHLEALKNNLLSLEQDPKEILVIDIHTGLGKKNSLNLLLPSEAQLECTAVRNLLGSFRYRFENRTQPVKPGIFCEWLCELISTSVPQGCRQSLPIVFEIGTSGNGGLLSEMSSLLVLVRANQLRFHGARDSHIAQEIVKRFEELFYPTDQRWRRWVLNFCTQQMQILMDRFDKLSNSL